MGVLREEGTHQAADMFMPDLSDVGPPAKGPGLPERIPEAPPPPVRVRIEHRPNCEMTRELTEAILAEVPEAEIEAVEGDEDTFEVEINGKLIFSKRELGHYPERDEIVEKQGQVLPPPLPLFRGGGRGAQDGDDGQEEHSSRQEDHNVLCDLLNSRS